MKAPVASSPGAFACPWHGQKLLQQRRRTGDIRPGHYRSGRKPKILAAHQHLGRKPDLTLAELRAAVGLNCSLPAIHYVLVDLERAFNLCIMPT